MQLNQTAKNNSISNTKHFSEQDNQILLKAMTAMHLQEEMYYEKKTNSYQLNWFDIFPLLLTEEEKHSGFGYMINHIGWNQGNDLQDLYHQRLNIKHPSQLMPEPFADEEDPAFQAYFTEYQTTKMTLIQPIIEEWERIKDSLIEEETA